MGKSLDGKELGNGILQKKDGRYEARFTDRFGNRKSISGRDLKDVKARYNEATYENDKEINLKDDLKLDEWYSRWINIYKFGTIRENTKRHYEQVFKKHISPVLGNINLKDITQFQIRELIKDLDNNGYKFETKSKVKIILVDMFDKAMTDEFVKRNPARGIQIKKKSDKGVQVLSQEDQITFFDCCKGTFYDNFYTVAVNTGMRIGELAALREQDIDFKNMVVNVSRTLVYQKYLTDTCKTFHFELPKTNTSLRTIPINSRCEVALKKQLIQKKVVESKACAEKKTEEQFRDLLFTTKYNTPLNSQIVCDSIERIVNEINMMRDVTDELPTFSCHCFRHTFATRCFEAGISPKTVQSYLGHATLAMTMDLYTVVLDEYRMNEMGKFDAELDKLERNGDNTVEAQYSKMSSKHTCPMINIGDKMVASK